MIMVGTLHRVVFQVILGAKMRIILTAWGEHLWELTPALADDAGHFGIVLHLGQFSCTDNCSILVSLTQRSPEMVKAIKKFQEIWKGKNGE